MMIIIHFECLILLTRIATMDLYFHFIFYFGCSAVDPLNNIGRGHTSQNKRNRSMQESSTQETETPTNDSTDEPQNRRYSNRILQRSQTNDEEPTIKKEKSNEFFCLYVCMFVFYNLSLN